MKQWHMWLLLLISFWLVACEATTEPVDIESIAVEEVAVEPTPTLVRTVPPVTVEPIESLTGAETTLFTATPIPTNESLPAPTSSPLPLLPDIGEQALAEHIIMNLAPDTLASETGSPGFEGIYVQALQTTDGRFLWGANSYGFRAFDPPADHFVAIYEREGAEWREVSQLSLINPDYVFENSLRQVPGPDGRLWLELESGAGAHSGCYELLSFDGIQLQSDVSHCHSSPVALYRGLGDLNGDGEFDLVLNQTVDYVFCYACGVRLPLYTVLTWQEDGWQEVDLTPLPESVPATIRDLNNQAVVSAQAGLWRDADTLINQIESNDPIVIWNQIIIDLHAMSMKMFIEQGPYPLLHHLFYGDYETVLAHMQLYPPAELFTIDKNPLIIGTVAEGWEDTLAEWVIGSTTTAVETRTDLAVAYFLRGWGHYLAGASVTTVLADVEQAALLAPEEPLFQASVVYLQDE